MLAQLSSSLQIIIQDDNNLQATYSGELNNKTERWLFQKEIPSLPTNVPEQSVIITFRHQR